MSDFSETLMAARAVELYRLNPDAALAGQADYSSPEDYSTAIIELASDHRDRFLELISYLPDQMQDIFIQFYIMRRTQAQIGETVGLPQGQGYSCSVHSAIQIGLRAICAIIESGQDPSKMNGHHVHYAKAVAWKTKPSGKKPLRTHLSAHLGQFSIPLTQVDLSQLFVFKWRHGETKN